MGPAVSTFFNPQFSTPFSGEATPSVYLACLVAILVAATGIVEMARELPSAGAFYTRSSKDARSPCATSSTGLPPWDWGGDELRVVGGGARSRL